MILMEMGLYKFWFKQNRLNEMYNCKIEDKTSAQKMPIKLHDLISAFLIFGIGIFLAVLFFIAELLWKLVPPIYPIFDRKSDISTQ